MPNVGFGTGQACPVSPHWLISWDQPALVLQTTQQTREHHCWHHWTTHLRTTEIPPLCFQVFGAHSLHSTP